MEHQPKENKKFIFFIFIFIIYLTHDMILMCQLAYILGLGGT
jgi:hypothetical protein